MENSNIDSKSPEYIFELIAKLDKKGKPLAPSIVNKLNSNKDKLFQLDDEIKELQIKLVKAKRLLSQYKTMNNLVDTDELGDEYSKYYDNVANISKKISEKEYSYNKLVNSCFKSSTTVNLVASKVEQKSTQNGKKYVVAFDPEADIELKPDIMSKFK
jgi:hypothetical protein